MSSSLVAIPLERWRDPASVFAAGPHRSEHAFWLDAGPGATTGWSWVGFGAAEPDAERVRRVECVTAPDGTWPAGPFRGGWVGWFGYEPAAAAAGAPVALPDRVVPPDQLLPLAYEWAERLANGPTLAIGMTKRMINNEWNMDLLSALEAEAQAQALLMMGQDHRTFYEAFTNKVKPVWSGR